MSKRKPTHPGMVLKYEYLKPMGITYTQLAEHIDVHEKSIAKLVQGHKPLTVKLAKRLALAFNTTLWYWMNLQIACDIWDMEHSDNLNIKPIKGKQQ